MQEAGAIRKRHGAAIQRYREHRELSRKELAGIVGVHVSALTQWEKGVTSPSDVHRIALAEHLRVPVAVLFNLEPVAVA